MQENIKNQNLSEDKQQPIQITISDPQARLQYGGAKQYYIYNLKGKDAKGVIQIQRRFSDFQLLRSTLTKRWPGCFISSLPAKVKLAHSDEEFLQIRSMYLEKFMHEIAKKQYLWYSEELQFFVKIKQQNSEKVLGAFSKIDMKQLSYRYSVTFKHLSESGLQRNKENISEFEKQLGHIFIKVQQLRNKAQEIFNTQTKYQKKYLKLINGLISYQHKARSHYVQNQKEQATAIVSSEQTKPLKEQFQQSLNDMSFKLLFEELKRQKRQIFAAQQSLKIRSEYLKQKERIQGKIREHEIKIQELKNGKKSLMSKIRNIATDTDIQSHEKSITKYKEQLGVVAQLCSIINSIIVFEQIQSYKEERKSSYYKMVRDIIKLEHSLIKKQHQFWSCIAKNKQCGFQIEQIPYVQSVKNTNTMVQQINNSNDNKEEINNFLNDEENQIEIDLKDQKIEKQVVKPQQKQSQSNQNQKIEQRKQQPQSTQNTIKTEQPQQFHEKQSDHQEINQIQKAEESIQQQKSQLTEIEQPKIEKNEDCQTLKVKPSQENITSADLQSQIDEKDTSQLVDLKKGKLSTEQQGIKQEEKGEENIEPEQVNNSK